MFLTDFKAELNRLSIELLTFIVLSLFVELRHATYIFRHCRHRTGFASADWFPRDSHAAERYSSWHHSRTCETSHRYSPATSDRFLRDIIRVTSPPVRHRPTTVHGRTFEGQTMETSQPNSWDISSVLTGDIRPVLAWHHSHDITAGATSTNNGSRTNV